jgi:hypothetical protein
MKTPLSFYKQIKAEFDAAGVTIFAYWTGVSEVNKPEEIDYMFEAAKTLGAKGVTGNPDLRSAARLAGYPEKHGMFYGLHNHDNLSDPDAFSNQESFEKGFALSPSFMAELDMRHFTAANGDCVAFLEKWHHGTACLHVGDRRRDNGHSEPFGRGDTPIIECLRMIKDNKWPIVALLAFEHGTTRSSVDEVQIALDYCKRALA